MVIDLVIYSMSLHHIFVSLYMTLLFVMSRRYQCCHLEINECKELTHNCIASGEKCLNTPGTFVCVCLPGYTRDISGNCVNTDDCVNNTCTPFSTCVDELNGYRCTCKPGTRKIEYADGTFHCKR